MAAKEISRRMVGLTSLGVIKVAMVKGERELLCLLANVPTPGRQGQARD